MIAGQDGLLKLRLTNTGGYRYAGPVNVTVFASADAIVSSDDASIATASLPQASFRPGASKRLKLKLSFPASLPDGAYYFVAQVAATDTQTVPAVTATPSAMQIAPAHADLAATFGDSPIRVDPGRTVSHDRDASRTSATSPPPARWTSASTPRPTSSTTRSTSFWPSCPRARST